MKKYLFTILVGLFITGGVVYAGAPFLSRDLAPTPSNGKILQTDGTNSAWVTNTATGGYPFTPATNFATIMQGTTSPLWLRGSPISLSASSTSQFDYSTTTAASFGTASSTTFIAGAGITALPSYSFSGFPNAGLGFDGTFVKTSTGGALRTYVGSTGFFSNVNLISNTAVGFIVKTTSPTVAAPIFSFVNDQDTGYNSTGANTLSMSAGATEVFRSDIASTTFPVGNIGIGTTSPGTPLSVQGVANFTTSTSTFQSTGGIALTAGCFQMPNGTCLTSGSTYPFPLTGNATSTLTRFTGGLFASSTSLFDTIGVNTAPLFATLEVQGTTTTAGGRAFAAWNSAATNLMTIQNDGNVGIGVTNPGTKLTVSNQTTIQAPVSGSTAQFVGTDANPLRITYDTHNNSSTSGTALMFRRSRGTSATPLADIVDDVIGSLNFRGYGTTGYAAGSTALMTAKAEGTFTDTSMPTAITFDTTPAGSVTATEKLRITGGGQVAIGTTTPHKLAIETIASSTPYLDITDTDAATDKKHWLMSNIDGKFSLGTSTDAMTSTSTALSIEGSVGTFVGIGATTTPWRTLSVVGTMAVNGLSSATGKNAVCIDATTKEFVDAGSNTCTLSSIYVKDVTGKVSPEVAQYIIDRMNAITFNYKGEIEQHYGFVAEEMAQIDVEVAQKFGIFAHLAEYATEDVSIPNADGTTHFFKKGDPIGVQYANLTAVLAIHTQDQDKKSDLLQQEVDLLAKFILKK